MTKPSTPRSDKAAQSPGYCVKCGEPIEEGQYYHHRRDKAGVWWHCSHGCCQCSDPHLKTDRADTSPAVAPPSTSQAWGSGSSDGGKGDGGDGEGPVSGHVTSSVAGGDGSDDWDYDQLESLAEDMASGQLEPTDAMDCLSSNSEKCLRDFFSQGELDALASVANGCPSTFVGSGPPMSSTGESGGEGEGSQVDATSPGDGAEGDVTEQDVEDALSEALGDLSADPEAHEPPDLEAMLKSMTETGNPAIDAMLNALGLEQKVKDLAEAMEKRGDARAQQARREAIDHAAQEAKAMLDKVRQRAEEALEEVKAEAIPPVQIILPDPNGGTKQVTLNMTHYLFEPVMHLVSMGFNVYLWGPPGGGKSTIVRQVAQALDRRFAYASLSPQTPESRLVGYLDAQGRYIMAALADFWENGGVFCVDELDNVSPGLAVLINTMLDSDKASLPHGMIDKHPDFVLVCCGNTPGTGADWLFPGRRKFDGAFRERFMAVPFDYDEQLESAMVKAENPNGTGKLWLQWVRDVRAYCKGQQIPLVVSPRAAKHGARCLAQPKPMLVKDIAEYALFKGSLDEPTVTGIMRNVPFPADLTKKGA